MKLPRPLAAESSYTRLIVQSVGLTAAYVAAALISAAGDWFDASYIYYDGPFLRDFANAMLAVGLWTGLYIAAEVYLLHKHTRDLNRSRRMTIGIIIIVLALFAAGVTTRYIHNDLSRQVQKLIDIRTRRPY